MPFKDPDKQRKYQREWRAKRRKAWLEKNGPCRRCGSEKDLQVDHIVPGTKVHHNVWSWAQQRREEELSKCQVLCRPCHVKKSMECGERRVAKHGGPQMYQVYKCRCFECRAWKAASDRKYKKKKK